MKQDFSIKQDSSMAVNKASLTPSIIPPTPDPKTSTKRRTPGLRQTIKQQRSQQKGKRIMGKVPFLPRHPCQFSC
ncbi:hypothetical protein HanRHA438_Chr06g0271711 [Helianthus annuus]|uniref:Uncharacterized protein n=1 Tax=Helianthus annuus TaxID=4232 RepID=A0A9K3IV77_HELAN|nr:hypothetical protein HanXRQr2_Chr06g0262461 [Helianthus annuus]KAJ0912211.1 hypothetical protein HanRHA438_Chr06g0271711 [Helianthus annuus]KAJ0915722.1 hypothetical protein HanPSC8_Chr06g0253141 [Helianthus annuus]